MLALMRCLRNGQNCLPWAFSLTSRMLAMKLQSLCLLAGLSQEGQVYPTL